MIDARSGGTDGPDGGRVRDRAGQSGEGDRCRAVTLPRPDPGEHLVQDDAQAVDVGGGRGLLATRLLRAEVMDRAEGRPRQRHLCLGDRPGDAEVGDLDPAVGPDQDVARLDVAVDEPAGMSGGEGLRDAGPDPGDLPRVERTAPAQDRREVLPVDQLHDDVRAARVLAEVVDGDDVGVAERGRRLGLRAETRREIGIAQVLRTEQLERDVATELGIGGAVDGRHPAAAQQLDQAVAAAQRLSDLGQIVPSWCVAGPSALRVVPRHRTPRAGRSGPNA